MSEPLAGAQLPEFTMEDVSLEQIVGLMELMQDTNPVHVDAELAARLGLRGPVAQGPASLAYVINMLIGWRGDGFLERLDFRFEDTVTLGDTATARGVVQEVDGERVKCEFWLGLQTGTQALNGVATVRLPATSDD